MTKAKNTYLLLFFLTFSLFTKSQTTPYAEIINQDINVCSQTTTTVELQIRFYGDAPFAYTIKLPNSNEIFENNPIFANDLTNGVYYVTYNINFPVQNGDQKRTGTFEITEVFDNTNAPWTYGNGNSMTGVSVALTNWAMPSPNAGSDIDSCGLEATLGAIPDPISSNYYWTAPTQGTISDLQSPTSSYQTAQKGTYELFFNQENGACSAQDNVAITFRGSPSATLTSSSEVCGTSDQEAILELSFGGGDGPWDYMLTDNNSHTLNGTATTSTLSETTIVNGETTFSYSWVKDTNGCYAKPSDISDEALVTDLLPNTNAGNDETVCGLDYQLQAIPDKGTGLWTVSDLASVTILSDSDPQTNVSVNQQSTYTFTWTENNKGCTNSDQVQIQFIEYPSINWITTRDTVCEGNKASVPFTVSGSNGPWNLTYTTNGTTSDFGFSNPSPILNLSPMETTQYEVTALTDNFGCTSSLNQVLNIKVDQMPTPFAGEDNAFCGLEASLDATKSALAQSGMWEMDNGTIKDNDIQNPKATFISNNYGSQTLTWTEVNGLCTASDQVEIRLDEPPLADIGDDFTLYHQYQTTLRAKAPISSQGQWQGEWYIQSGPGNIANPTQQETEITALKHGKTIVEWAVTNGVCPTETDTITLTIKGLTYHTGMSPNRDGVNDYFKIKGAHTIPNNELIVFDQNGQVVFRQKDLPANNQWEGIGLDGTALENGIYYFIFEGDGIEPLKDYIVIKRN